MKKNKKLCWGLALLIVIMGLTACSGKKSETSMNSMMDISESETVGFSTAQEEPKESLDSTNDKNITSSNQKLITYVNMTIETLEYDPLMEGINNTITQVNGYIQSSESYGRQMNQTNLRHAVMTIRVPSDRVNEFMDFIGSSATVTNKSIRTEDVTMNYVDAESRKKALETQLERLFVLLEQAENMEDIITLEQRISDVTYELESYTSTIRTYDNLVDYSTLTINVSEVERESNPEPENIWDEMKNGLSDSLYNIKNSLQSFAIWFVSNIPYLIFWAAVITGGILIWKKKRNKKNEGAYNQGNQNVNGGVYNQGNQNVNQGVSNQVNQNVSEEDKKD